MEELHFDTDGRVIIQTVGRKAGREYKKEVKNNPLKGTSIFTTIGQQEIEVDAKGTSRWGALQELKDENGKPLFNQNEIQRIEKFYNKQHSQINPQLLVGLTNKQGELIFSLEEINKLERALSMCKNTNSPKALLAELKNLKDEHGNPFFTPEEMAKIEANYSKMRQKPVPQQDNETFDMTEAIIAAGYGDRLEKRQGAKQPTPPTQPTAQQPKQPAATQQPTATQQPATQPAADTKQPDVSSAPKNNPFAADGSSELSDLFFAVVSLDENANITAFDTNNDGKIDTNEQVTAIKTIRDGVDRDSNLISKDKGTKNNSEASKQAFQIIARNSNIKDANIKDSTRKIKRGERTAEKASKVALTYIKDSKLDEIAQNGVDIQLPQKPTDNAEEPVAVAPATVVPTAADTSSDVVVTPTTPDPSAEAPTSTPEPPATVEPAPVGQAPAEPTTEEPEEAEDIPQIEYIAPEEETVSTREPMSLEKPDTSITMPKFFLNINPEINIETSSTTDIPIPEIPSFAGLTKDVQTESSSLIDDAEMPSLMPLESKKAQMNEFERNGDYRSALAIADEILKLDPEAEGMEKKRKALIPKAIEQAKKDLATCEQNNDYKGALAIADEILSLNPKAKGMKDKKKELTIKQAEKDLATCEQNNDYNGALKAVNTLLQYKPKDPELLTRRGDINYKLKNYDDAIKDYTEVISTLPKEPQKTAQKEQLSALLTKRADAELARNNDTKGDRTYAEADYGKAARLDKDNAHANAEYAKIRLSNSDPDKAMEYINNALAQQPDNPEFLRIRAEIFNAQGDKLHEEERYAEAEKAYNNAIADDKKPLYLRNKANSLYKQGKYNDALGAIDEAIGLLNENGNQDKTELAELQNLKGDIYYVQEDYENAEKAYNNAIADDKKPLYLQNKANSLYKQGKYNDALGAIDEAIGLLNENGNQDKTELAELQNLKGHILFAQEKYAEAEIVYTEAIKNDDSEPIYLRNKANNLYNLGENYDDALGAIDKAIGLLGDNPDPTELADYQNVKGDILFAQGKYAEAEKAYTEAIKNDSSISLYFQNRAHSYRKQGKYDAALQDANKAIGLLNENGNQDKTELAELQNLKGDIYYVQEDYENAEKAYTEAIKNDSSISLYFQNRAHSYRKQGKYVAALQDANKAIELESENAYNYTARAGIYEAQNKTNLAIADYGKALEYDPNNQEAQEALARLTPHETEVTAAPGATATDGTEAPATDGTEAPAVQPAAPEAAATDGTGASAVQPAGEVQPAGTVPPAAPEATDAKDDTAVTEPYDEQKVDALRQSAWDKYYKADLEGALNDIDEAIRLLNDSGNPDLAILAELQNLKGNIYYVQEDYENAANAYSIAIENDKENPLYFHNRAKCYRELKAQDKAIDDTQKAIALIDNAIVLLKQNGNQDKTELAELYNLKGDILYDQEKYAEAEIAYTEAIENDNSVALYYNNRSTSRHKLGNNEGATEDTARALLAHTNNKIAELEQSEKPDKTELADYYELKGECHDKLKETELAIEAYEEALKYNPNYKEAQEALARLTQHETEVPAAPEAPATDGTGAPAVQPADEVQPAGEVQPTEPEAPAEEQPAGEVQPAGTVPPAAPEATDAKDDTAAAKPYDEKKAIDLAVSATQKGRDGDLDGAIKDLTEAIEMEKTNPNSSNLPYRYEDRAEYHVKKANIEAQNGHPDDAKAHIDAAIADYEAAIKGYKEAISRNEERHPSMVETLYETIAKLKLSNNDLVGALEAINIALDGQEQTSMDYILRIATRARIYTEMANTEAQNGNEAAAKGHRDAAIADYTEIIEKEPVDSELRKSAYYPLADLQIKNGDLDGAVATLTSAIDTSEYKSADLYIKRAGIYEQLGEYDKAIADYQAAENRTTPNRFKNQIEAATQAKSNKYRQEHIGELYDFIAKFDTSKGTPEEIADRIMQTPEFEKFLSAEGEQYELAFESTRSKDEPIDIGQYYTSLTKALTAKHEKQTRKPGELDSYTSSIRNILINLIRLKQQGYPISPFALNDTEKIPNDKYFNGQAPFNKERLESEVETMSQFKTPEEFITTREERHDDLGRLDRWVGIAYIISTKTDQNILRKYIYKIRSKEDLDAVNRIGGQLYPDAMPGNNPIEYVIEKNMDAAQKKEAYRHLSQVDPYFNKKYCDLLFKDAQGNWGAIQKKLEAGDPLFIAYIEAHPECIEKLPAKNQPICYAALAKINPDKYKAKRDDCIQETLDKGISEAAPIRRTDKKDEHATTFRAGIYQIRSKEQFDNVTQLWEDKLIQKTVESPIIVTARRLSPEAQMEVFRHLSYHDPACKAEYIKLLKKNPNSHEAFKAISSRALAGDPEFIALVIDLYDSGYPEYAKVMDDLEKKGLISE